MVTVESVSKTYGTGEVAVHALRDVSLTLATGDFAVMAGPSGSGKSTLLHIIGALDQADSGTVSVEGKPLADLSRTQLSRLRRDRLGFVFQSYNLIPVLTALENAEYVLMLQGVAQKERRERVREVLNEVGLAGLENRFPHELSGGQQQRVAITRAIVTKPALVLADEPTANLDSQTAQALLRIMSQLNEKYAITFLFSSHDPAVIAQAKRLFWLKDGVITETAEVALSRNLQQGKGKITLPPDTFL